MPHVFGVRGSRKKTRFPEGWSATRQAQTSTRCPWEIFFAISLCDESLEDYVELAQVETTAYASFSRGARACADVIQNDSEAQWRVVRQELDDRLSDLEGVLLHDTWEDRFHHDWQGMMLSYLSPCTGVPRDIWFGAEQLAKFANAYERRKSAIVQCNALRSMWHQRFAPELSYRGALDHMPPRSCLVITVW